MIVVLGASGQLGSAFVRLLGDSCLPATRMDLDLREPSSIAGWVASVHPETLINCAAYTAVDAAEEDSETARAVNAVAVGELAKACHANGGRFITFSTDYVFDGELDEGYVETDEPNPLNVYGQTKLEGEQLALDVNPSTLVVRTSWLLSSTQESFVIRIMRAIRRGEASVVNDQRGRPTFVDDLAKGTMEAVDSNADGVLHLTNCGDATWFDLAQQIGLLAGLDTRGLIAVPSHQLNRAATRPACSILNSVRLASLDIDPLPHYEEGLRALVRAVIEGQTGKFRGPRR